MTIKIAIDGPFVEAIVSEALSFEDLPALFDAFETARRNGPFVLMTNTLAMTTAPLSVIKTFAERLKQFPPMKDIWLGDAVIVSSPFTRFALSTLIMIAPLPTKVKVFDSCAQGKSWCYDILRTSHVPVPASLHTL